MPHDDDCNKLVLCVSTLPSSELRVRLESAATRSWSSKAPSHSRPKSTPRGCAFARFLAKRFALTQLAEFPAHAWVNEFLLKARNEQKTRESTVECED